MALRPPGPAEEEFDLERGAAQRYLAQWTESFIERNSAARAGETQITKEEIP